MFARLTSGQITIRDPNLSKATGDILKAIYALQKMGGPVPKWTLFAPFDLRGSRGFGMRFGTRATAQASPGREAAARTEEQVTQ